MYSFMTILAWLTLLTLFQESESVMTDSSGSRKKRSLITDLFPNPKFMGVNLFTVKEKGENMELNLSPDFIDTYVHNGGIRYVMDKPAADARERENKIYVVGDTTVRRRRRSIADPEPTKQTLIQLDTRSLNRIVDVADEMKRKLFAVKRSIQRPEEADAFVWSELQQQSKQLKQELGDLTHDKILKIGKINKSDAMKEIQRHEEMLDKLGVLEQTKTLIQRLPEHPQEDSLGSADDVKISEHFQR